MYDHICPQLYLKSERLDLTHDCFPNISGNLSTMTSQPTFLNPPNPLSLLRLPLLSWYPRQLRKQLPLRPLRQTS